MEKTRLGIPENLGAAIAYSFPPLTVISGFVMLVFETENKFVRFHAMQSFIVFIFFGAAAMLVGFIPFLGKPLEGIVSLAAIAAWIVLILNALRGKYYKFPIVGEAIYKKIVG